MSRILVVIPAKDEAHSIAHVIKNVQDACDYPIVVIDDGSQDNTAAIAHNAGAIVLSHVINMGAWRATQTGLRYAEREHFDAVITIDADGQHDANHIPNLLAAYEQGADVVIGSCTQRGSAGRHVTWRFFKWLSRLGVNDLTSGYRVYGRAAIETLASRQATMLEYQDIGVLLMLRHMKLNKAEINVDMTVRRDGISRIFYSWLAVYRYLLYTLILTVAKTLPMNKHAYSEKLSKEMARD